MASSALYPLRFAPLFQYRLWGGRRLAEFVSEPLPEGADVGEAWILSDRDDHPSVVAEGPLAGKTLREIADADRLGVFGRYADRLERYPLLLKLLDAREMLSVQVHPSDAQPHLLPPGERGKTEAWVVLQAEPQSRILAGLMPGTSADNIRKLNTDNADQYLASFSPKVGETAFLEAGTVHALGGGVVVFEVQQNSDVTFRLFDFDRIDGKTGQPRELHVDKALESTDFGRGPVRPQSPIIEAESPVHRERLVECTHFSLWRHTGHQIFTLGDGVGPRAVFLLDGEGEWVTSGSRTPASKGQVFFLPAALGEVTFQPAERITLFEVGLPPL